MNEGAPVINLNSQKWFQAFRDITNSTNERTLLAATIPSSGVGNNAPILDYARGRAIASALVLANINSLPFDWAARHSVGGTHLSFFIVKQLPVLPPEKYLERVPLSEHALTYVELIVPRVLELSYTAHDLQGFAQDIGYDGPPFPWDDARRHCVQSELDAVYAHMYELEKLDLEWILDAPAPSECFATLKRNERINFGEYRTKRYVLCAYDQLARGSLPELR